MSEAERHHISREDPYFQHDALIGDAVLRGEPYGLRLKLHEAEERFRNHEELFPLTQRTGTRRSFHAKPYVLEPEITLTAGLSSIPRPAGAIGEVTDAAWHGMRHREVGQAQDWYYPADRVLMIWECFLLDQYKETVPSKEMNLRAL